jgi:hypothetical protein
LEVPVQLDSEEILAQIRHDWPVEHELSTLRLLAEKQAAEIQRLTAAVSPTSTYAGPTNLYGSDSQEGRHG